LRIRLPGLLGVVAPAAVYVELHEIEVIAGLRRYGVLRAGRMGREHKQAESDRRGESPPKCLHMIYLSSSDVIWWLKPAGPPARRRGSQADRKPARLEPCSRPEFAPVCPAEATRCEPRSAPALRWEKPARKRRHLASGRPSRTGSGTPPAA